MTNQKQNRKLAAILFADIVGYTAIMQADEHQAMSRLERYQDVLKSTVKTHRGEVIKNYGDGSLCLFSSVLDAVNCAKDIQQQLTKEPKVPLRIGLHLGDVMYRDKDIYGNAVNVSSRIESMGVAGSVMMSKNIYEKVKNQSLLSFQSFGEFEFKNIEEPMEVFALANEGFALPKKEKITGKFKNSSGSNYLKIASIIGLLAAALWGWYYFSKSDDAINEEAAQVVNVSDNSIAVLPFDNMSVDPENEFFTSGMHDGLLTHLAKLSGIKVISRTSVKQYKNTEKPIPLIGQELSVANILEGSVQRAGDQLRVNVQLIDAASDEHLWSEIYDKTMTTDNIFDIQTEIVTQIARQLETSISANQKTLLDKRPTENLEAYEAYLRARQYIETRSAQSLQSAEELLKNAIDLDPEFALAHAMLSIVYVHQVDYAGANRSTNIKKARLQLGKASSLNPNLAEAHAIEGRILMKENKFDSAQDAFKRALAINPNYDRIYHWNSVLAKWFQKDTDKACALIQQAVAISPLDPSILSNVGLCQMEQGNYQQGIATMKKGISIDSEYPDLWSSLGDIYRQANLLDSMAIINYEAIKSNGKTGNYFRRYLGVLLGLQLNDVFLSELDRFQPKTKQDQQTKRRFEAVKTMHIDKEHSRILSIYNPFASKDNSNSSTLLRALYNARDWPNISKYFSKGYDEMENSDQLLNFPFLFKFDNFHQFIFALHKNGEHDRANRLWRRLGQPILDQYGDSSSTTMQENLSTIRARNAAIRKDKQAFLIILNEVNSDHWAWLVGLDDDPMSDFIKDDPQFIKIVNEIQAKLKVQQDVVRDYLKVKG